uniref:Guanine nucleotide-binding protein subunit gamma n=1 Tax=Panagrellus redivivus TaxID=6233 RepID=A0A7E4WCC8_PANRE
MYTCRTAAVRLYPGATTATTNMDVAKTQAEQLRHEASIQRKKVSEVAKDLIDYCEKEKPNDTLVCGPSDSHNPFQEKKSCIVL